MRLPAWLPFRRSDEADAIRVALLEETYLDPIVQDARDRLGMVLQAYEASQRALLAARRRGQVVDTLEATLSQRQRRVADYQSTYEAAVRAAHDRVWTRYREAVERGEDWTSVLTPQRRFTGNVRRIELEAQVKDPEPSTSPAVPGRVWGSAMKS